MEKVSRTQKKKAAQALQKMGEQLIGLNDTQLDALALPKDLQEAVVTARGIKKHEALRRQVQYIGRLMREADAAVIAKGLKRIQLQGDAQRRQFKQIELWRDELVAGDADRYKWLLDRFSEIDRPFFSKLVRKARSHDAPLKARKAARKLFRYLSQLEDGSETASNG